MMRLYLDAAPVIYTVEQVQPYAATVVTRLSANDLILVASDLTRMECRLKPMRDADASLLQDFDDFFENAVAGSTVIPNSSTSSHP
jgi:hypothetical protein